MPLCLHTNSLILSVYWRKEVIMADIASAALVSIVLVHGGFVDGSGWEDVYKALKKDGYKVAVVQNPTLSFADDVAATKRVIAQQNGPVVLVGHSYGGAVITEAGNDPKVTRLVYIAAFAPDKVSPSPRSSRIPCRVRPSRRSCRRRTAICLSTAQSSPPPSRPTWARRRPSSWPTRSSLGRGGAQRAISEPAWKTKPSWYLIATQAR